MADASYEDEDRGDPAEERRLSKDARSSYSQPYSDHMAGNRRSRFLGVGALALAAAIIAGIWQFSGSREQAAPVQTRLPKSEQVYEAPTVPRIDERTVMSRLDISPPIVSFGQLTASKDRQTVSLTLTAVDGPVDINQISLPFADQTGIDMRADGCQGAKLAANQRCAIVVQFVPQVAMNLASDLIVTGTTYQTGGTKGGKTQPLSTTVEITGSATTPPPPPPPPPVARDDSQDRLMGLQNAYLSARQGHGSLGEQAGRSFYKGPALPVEQDWASLGFKRNQSSLPVDMTRVVTMDKAIPVVIKVPIDTRNASRAVATVERDIYGGDGRTVLIERGSTMIGRVAAISDTSEEKVAISWQRVVRPDGVAFVFDSTSGDAMGRAGVLANIDNRWFERFGKTALLSFLKGGITIALNPTQNSTTQNGTSSSGSSGSVTVGGTTTVTENARTIANQQIQSDLLPLYEEYEKEQLQLPPIRTVPAGTRVTVWPTSDLWLREVPQGTPLDDAASVRYAAAGRSFNQLVGAAPSAAPMQTQAVGGTARTAVGPVGDALGVVTPDGAVGAPVPLDGGVAPVDTSLAASSASADLRERYRPKQAGTIGMANGGYATTGYPSGVTQYGSAAAPQVVTTTGQAIAAPPWSTGR